MDQQPSANESDDQNNTNSTIPYKGSRWKTGLNRFKNNVNKPTLLTLQIKNQENELNQGSSTDLKNHQKAVVVDIEDNNLQDSSYLKTKKIQINGNKKFLYSNKPLRQASSLNHTNQTQKLYLPSSFFNSNSSVLNNEDLLNNDKKVHFNTEESSNNDFSSIQTQKTMNNQQKNQFPPLQHNLPDSRPRTNKAKSEPIFHKHPNITEPYKAIFKSFDAHFKRQKEAIETFKKKDWQISERIYKLRSQKVHQLMNWKEFNPEAKVTFFTDNYITEEVIEEARREKKLNDLPEDSKVVDGKFKLPPDRQLSGYQRNRVYFWG